MSYTLRAIDISSGAGYISSDEADWYLSLDTDWKPERIGEERLFEWLSRVSVAALSETYSDLEAAASRVREIYFASKTSLRAKRDLETNWDQWTAWDERIPLVLRGYHPKMVFSLERNLARRASRHELESWAQKLTQTVLEEKPATFKRLDALIFELLFRGGLQP